MQLKQFLYQLKAHHIKAFIIYLRQSLYKTLKKY